MSTFDALEKSVESSQPVELYRFQLGGNPPYLYTPSQVDQVVGGLTYRSTAMRRGPIIRSQKDRQSVLSILVPENNPFACLYTGVPPGVKASMAILRIQSLEAVPTVVEQYTGVVQQVEFPADGNASISVLPTEGVVARKIPRWSYMGMCNHIIYGFGCEVDPAAHTFTGVVSAVNGNTITVTGAGSSGFDFTGGFVQSSTSNQDPRVVLAHSGDVITMMLPFRSVVVGSSVDCFRGCNHLLTGDCATIFDNVIQNGSFLWVPTKNFFQTGLR